jgi:plastocyanin
LAAPSSDVDDQRPILVVEDDDATRAFLLDNLAALGAPTRVPLDEERRRSGTEWCRSYLALPAAALAGDTRKVFVMDRCEPESFDAAVEPGTCIRNGGVTFDKFARRLNPQDGGHNAWRFGPPHFGLRSGQTITATNTGGETHTFTEVAAFGTGFVDFFNAALPPGTPPAQPVGAPNFMAARATLELDALPPGTHRYECLIHPWMRTVVEQG